jgi:folate-binding protein YgfZ
MTPLPLHEFHKTLGAQFGGTGGMESVLCYGPAAPEYTALRETVGVLDLSFRGRLCVVGPDRVRFLNGQVTNNVKALKPGMGCYAALTNNKGKMQSDLNLHALADELLLDFEPGLAPGVIERLEQFIVADDVQVVDVSGLYGLLTIQGPRAAALVSQLGLFAGLPQVAFESKKADCGALGELYLVSLPRLNTAGFDLFVPVAAMEAVADKLIAAAKRSGGCACGWMAFETARIEAGIPRYGADMDASNLPQEAGIETRAVSYTKGCYIGQEVINRLRSMGQVTRALRGLRLAAGSSSLPARGDKLKFNGREAGFVTSATFSPALQQSIALAYVRKECNQLGTELTLQTAEGESSARIVALPFAA